MVEFKCICVHCQKPYQSTWLHQQYCSLACRQAAYYQRKKQAHSSPKATALLCPQCKESALQFLDERKITCLHCGSVWLYSKVYSEREERRERVSKKVSK